MTILKLFWKIYFIHAVSGPHLCHLNTPSYLLLLSASPLQDMIKQTVLYFNGSPSRRDCETFHNVNGDLFSAWKCKSIHFISHRQFFCGSQGYVWSICAIFIVCCTKESCLQYNDASRSEINNISGNMEKKFRYFESLILNFADMLPNWQL